MSKQDLNKARTPTDLERKYNFAGMQKAIKNTELGINKTNKTLQDFTSVALKSFENIESQLDGNVATHFYSGVPSLENVPANEWITNEEKENHLSDLYYDKDTGKVYEFGFQDNTYCWIRTDSNAVIEAMALANAAKDTADGKRRIFTVQPIPPYDNGDLWLNNQELYVCQISKAEDESYEENDFIIATKYTDNTLARQVGDELTVLRGTVTTIKESADSFQIEIEEKVTSIDELQQETVEQFKKTSYVFGTEDFTVSKEGEEIETHISHDGMTVKKNGQDVLVANNKGVDATNLHAKTYLLIGQNSRFEDYGMNRTGCFWIGS